MSWQAAAWASEQVAGSAAAKLVLLVLANIADKSGVCWPSIAQIAEDSEMSERSVHTHLRGLRDKGLITWEHRVRKDGSRSSSQYRLMLTKLQISQGAPANLAPPPLQDLQGGGAGVAEQEEPVIEPVKDTPARKHARCAQGVPSSDGFDAWYSAYPRKVDRGRARKAYATAAKKAPAEQLLAAAINYAASRAGQDPKYTKHPATWLNAESWLDEPEPTQQRPIPGMSVWGDDIATPPPGHIEGMGVWDL